ncbi:MAG: pyridoxamine 5'-phosphate oxidase [Cyclobacteriaceae bacterium]
MNEIEKIRNEYSQKSLSKRDVSTDPIHQFDTWFKEVIASEIYEPTACTLATASLDGKPSARTILLKGYSVDGFRFFTNYESKKGKDLETNPFAAITFFWKELERQVQIRGRVEKLNEASSDAYFKSRPIGSQIAAIASPQSKVIPNREYLENKGAEVREQFKNDPVRPENWGGYLLIPDYIEFWQGRPSRLHDRIRYLNIENNWQIDRLAP